MGLDLRYVAAGLGLAAAAYVFFVRGPEKNSPVATQPPPAAKGAAAPKTQIIAPEDKGRSNAQELENQRRAHSLKHLMKIKTLPTRTEGDRRILTVQTALEALWCKSGDFDLLKAVVKDPKKKDYALTLEALDGSRSQQGINLSFADISRSAPVNLNLPKLDDAQAFGLYLCSDPDNKKSCREKAPIPQDIYKAAVDKIPGKLNNKIIYFQYLIIDASGPQLIPSEDWSSERFATLRKAMKGNIGSSERDLEKARMLLAQLQPLPARLNGDSLQIPLAYNDPRCVN